MVDDAAAGAIEGSDDISVLNLAFDHLADRTNVPDSLVVIDAEIARLAPTPACWAEIEPVRHVGLKRLAAGRDEERPFVYWQQVFFATKGFEIREQRLHLLVIGRKTRARSGDQVLKGYAGRDHVLRCGFR